MFVALINSWNTPIGIFSDSAGYEYFFQPKSSLRKCMKGGLHVKSLILSH